jgi:hypothetical protein
MRKVLKYLGILLALAVLAASWPAWRLFVELDKARSEDPLVWEEDIRALEAATRGSFPPGEAVVFIGSSSIRFWDSLHVDMAPIPVIQHGFGGAKLNDAVYYADRLVSAYRPRSVVVFAGSNDITPSAAKTPEILLASYRKFVGKVRQQQPDLPIYYIAITPSPRRWEVWSIVQTTNALIVDFCATDDKLHFIDTGPALLDSAGEADPSNYVFDKLHLSEKGYRIWTSIIRPRLLADMPEYAE